MQRIDQCIDNFIMNGNDNIKKTVRKYSQGGSSSYGAADYGTNDSYLQYTWEESQANRQRSNEDYNTNMKGAQSEYQNFLDQSHKEYLQNQQTYSTVKAGVTAGLNAPTGPGNVSWRKNINNDVTNWMTNGQDGTNANYNETGNLGRPNRAGNPNKGLSIHDPNYTASLENTMSYDQWSEAGAQTDPGFNASRKDYRGYKKEMTASREVPRGADGMPLQGEELAAAEQDSIKKGLFEKGSYSGVSAEALDIAKTAGSQGAPAAVGTGFSTAEGTFEQTAKGLKQTHGPAGESLKGGNLLVNTASKAPVKGGLWTMPVDIGLHYLSDDNDPSTYTAGEVGTDVASLALDIVTFDWVGAVLQIGDMVMQGTQAKKIKKDRKKALDKYHKDSSKATLDWEMNQEDDADYKGSQKALYGRKANLGGFKYNI